MKHLLVMVLAGFLFACNDGENTETGDRPRDPNEAAPDSLRIVNDSVFVIDSNNQGVDATQHDTARNKMN